jgi:hypothetical protein
MEPIYTDPGPIKTRKQLKDLIKDYLDKKIHYRMIRNVALNIELELNKMNFAWSEIQFKSNIPVT